MSKTAIKKNRQGRAISNKIIWFLIFSGLDFKNEFIKKNRKEAIPSNVDGIVSNVDGIVSNEAVFGKSITPPKFKAKIVAEIKLQDNNTRK